MTGLKAVLFDLDGTLYDRDAAQSRIVAQIARERGDIFAGIDEERIQAVFAESDRLAVAEFDAGGPDEVARIGRSRRFLRMLGLDERYADELTAMYVASYSHIHAPIDGAVDAVTRLSGRFDLGVVSNGLHDVQYEKLRSLGIDHLLRCIILSSEAGVRKPDPAIFLEACEVLGRVPRECIYVGDLYDMDVVGAKVAGLRACWINARGERRPQNSVPPDIEIGCIGELPSALGLP